MSTDQLNRVTHSPNSSGEQCTICFEDFIDQKIGIPEHCEHEFCFSCLVAWTKEKNSCPIDRQTFQYIFKKHSISSHRPFAKVDINDTQSEIYLEEEVISCHACDDDDQEYHPLLTCTQCRNSYHEFCLNSFDTSTWMCPSCGYNHEESTKSVDNPLMIRPTRRQIRTFGLRDEGRTLRIARPVRRLQRITPQNPTRKIENLSIRNSSSLSSTIQARKTHENNPSVRSIITPTEAARRIAASSKPILSCPQSTALISQVKNMAALQRKRKLFARLPPRIPVNQLPRIQHRADAPFQLRSKAITQKSNPRASASFIDKLLHSQKQLYSLENIQMQGAHIKLS